MSDSLRLVLDINGEVRDADSRVAQGIRGDVGASR